LWRNWQTVTKNMYADLTGSTGKPNVQINIVNNSGQEITDNTDVQFNGKDFVITTVLESVAQNKGGMRDSLKSMMK